MKKILYSVALLAATMIGFTSCDEEEKVDVKEQAVGDYTVTSTYYWYDGKALEDMELEDDEPAAAKVVLDGDGLKMTCDGDVVSIVKIAEASNGFTFDVKEMSFTEEGQTYTLKGFNGYELKSSDGKSVSYNGGYISANKTLEFYVELPTADVAKMFAELFEGNEELATVFANLSVVMKFTCVKTDSPKKAGVSKGFVLS